MSKDDLLDEELFGGGDAFEYLRCIDGLEQ